MSRVLVFGRINMPTPHGTRRRELHTRSLDGTLVDSVYQHVMGRQEALQAEHIELSTWRIHRRIGMSGGLFTGMLPCEIDIAVSPALLDRLRSRHSEAYGRLVPSVRPLAGALSGGDGQDGWERAGAIRVYGSGRSAAPHR
jgi:hypothetical protein